MSEVTILVLEDTVIVPIQIELDDDAAMRLRDNILVKIECTGAKGLLIDISAVALIDTFLGRILVETAKMAQLMGCETVLAGMRKEVVISLIYLGLTLTGLNSALNLEHGLELLDRLKARGGTPPGGNA